MPAHLLFAHLPLALIAVAAGGDLLGALLQRDAYRRVAGTLLILGSAAAVLAFLTGQAAVAVAFARPSPNYPQIELHSLWAGAGVWLVAAAGGLRLAWRNALRGVHGWINLGAALATLVLIAAISRSGLAIAHGG